MIVGGIGTAELHKESEYGIIINLSGLDLRPKDGTPRWV
jgi:hypothetical protein